MLQVWVGRKTLSRLAMDKTPMGLLSVRFLGWAVGGRSFTAPPLHKKIANSSETRISRLPTKVAHPPTSGGLTISSGRSSREDLPREEDPEISEIRKCRIGPVQTRRRFAAARIDLGTDRSPLLDLRIPFSENAR